MTAKPTPPLRDQLFQGIDLHVTTLCSQPLTFEAYLTYSDGTDNRYELIEGQLVSMVLGTGKHTAIIRFLSQYLEQQPKALQHNWVAIQAMIGIRSPRGTRWDTVRIPDITLPPKNQLQALESRQCVIDLHEPPPLLVVEVVSESTKSTDYRAKWVEYAALNIPEYWIVDPLDQVMTVCALDEGRYRETEFRDEMAISSPTFPSLSLSPVQLWLA